MTERRVDGDRLLAAAVGRAAPWLVPLVLLGLVGAAAHVALPAVLGRAVDQVVAASQGGDDWAAARRSLALAAALVGVVVAEEAASQLVSGIGAARTAGDLRRRLVRHVLAAGPGMARRMAAGDLVARLVGGVTAAARGVLAVAGLAGAVVPPLGGAAALALIDPWLALTFAGGMAAASGAVRAYLRDARRANAGYLEAQGAIAARLVDALAGARTIAAARTTGRELARVLGPLPELRRHGTAAWRTMAQLAFRGEPVVLLTQVAVVAVAGLGLAGGRLSAGEMLAASRYAVMAAGIGGVVGELSGLTRARAGADRVAGVLAEPVTSHGNLALPPGAGRLELRGVTAGPPGATGQAVLEGLDLVVPAGSVVALVGRSGAGKSLVAALAGRLCDPAAGEVRLDGVPLPRLSRRALRRAVAYAFERPHLLDPSPTPPAAPPPGRTVGGGAGRAIGFGTGHGTAGGTVRAGADRAIGLGTGGGAGNGTVGGAIGFGPGPGRPPAERIRRAARAAGADRFVSRLPGGYAAPLAATPMSGGERQRLGLARALARNARLLILDDATSSLDTASEAEITAALTSPAPGGRSQTRLVVTHRATTAARADLVAWLDGGRIRAFGPHRQLWADPDYRSLFLPAPPPAAPAAAVTAGGRA